MDNNDKSQSASESSGFWTTLPGILTGIAGVIGAVTALILGLQEVGIIGQNSTPSPPPSPSPTSTPTSTPTQPASPSNPRWEFMGSASTGEIVSVDSSSINKSGETINFTYKIGNEIVNASADCNTNRWYANGYGWTSPQSKTTQDMLNYVCSF